MVVFVLTVPRPTCLVHEPKAPFQVASFPIGHHPGMCPVVSALSAQLPKPGRNDAVEGSDGGSYDGVSLGAFLMPPNFPSDADHT